MYVSWVFADKLRMVMSSIMRWRSGEIGCVIGELLSLDCTKRAILADRRLPTDAITSMESTDRPCPLPQRQTIRSATPRFAIGQLGRRNWTIGPHTFATGSLPRSGLVQREVWKIDTVLRCSVRLRARELHDLRPLLGFVRDELSELSRGPWHRHTAELH